MQKNRNEESRGRRARRWATQVPGHCRFHVSIARRARVCESVTPPRAVVLLLLSSSSPNLATGKTWTGRGFAATGTETERETSSEDRGPASQSQSHCDVCVEGCFLSERGVRGASWVLEGVRNGRAVEKEKEGPRSRLACSHLKPPPLLFLRRCNATLVVLFRRPSVPSFPFSASPLSSVRRSFWIWCSGILLHLPPPLPLRPPLSHFLPSCSLPGSSFARFCGALRMELGKVLTVRSAPSAIGSSPRPSAGPQDAESAPKSPKQAK